MLKFVNLETLDAEVMLIIGQALNSVVCPKVNDFEIEAVNNSKPLLHPK